MTATTDQPVGDDILGIGFGPSNLALAIALETEARHGPVRPSARFLERQARFGWHRAMMLPGADMQISFVKDLVSLRDPTNPFSFLNYLHRKGRLIAFLNLKTFNPSRVEYNDYLAWAAEHFAESVAYGEGVEAVHPEIRDGRLAAFRLAGRTESGAVRMRRCRHLVVAAGGDPWIPEPFGRLRGDRRLVHSSWYLPGIAAALGNPRLDGPERRVLVVGGGQSAVEIAVDAGARYPRARIDLAIRAPALKPADDSPFVNEIFDPAAVDRVHGAPEPVRAELIAAHRDTNYAVVDADLIQSFYQTLYEQDVSGETRYRLLRSTRVVAIAPGPAGLAATLRDDVAGTQATKGYDAVICATGYTRAAVPTMLDPLRPFMAAETVDRHYRLPLAPAEPRLSLHLQGFAEASHGLTETLLSILPIRAGEIAATILDLERAARGAIRPAAE
ncbi:lysine N(6)-hydroxylase/L-ornithine N(5)-oxygenase family protein [Methylobacterium gregans]|uniref:L-ornithine N(5)-monooxygenase n=1 Tax=Methylobacterium gregans TaxID=374424 RepID=A0AA37HPD2_9HYPH|nr:lysine N(6)-hydroxylase/L-ornithine N(5)-oxygenase family protein [Methylobacterium gregans]MDQ0520586.1 L-ornithine N5-oxygenase [Methylobacterium gregans]GJD79190.1 L-ornithine N(5)-monooxygenase [Methylobacterium gregans]GLS56607.1 L-ornithine N(5)-monooxygenase [Methylobacterium gregans]